MIRASGMRSRPLHLLYGLMACRPGDEPDRHRTAPPDPVPVGAPPADTSDTAPPPTTPALPTLVETRAATPLGLEAVSVNGRIQPRGRPTSYWFELGETVAYGRQTAPAALPPRIGAWYHESWDEHLAGWQAGMSGPCSSTSPTAARTAATSGTRSRARRTSTTSTASARTCWRSTSTPAPSTSRRRSSRSAAASRTSGARGSPSRSAGRTWTRTGRRSRSGRSPARTSEGADPILGRWSNWAFTGTGLTDALSTGAWEQVTYTLDDDTNAWSYAGHYVAADRPTYVYVPLDDVLRRMNGNLFHMPVLFTYWDLPTGLLEFDEFELAYRNASVLVPANGGSLVSAPAGDPSERLTDGWRNGDGHTWQSPAPVAPLEIVYALADPVAIHTVQVHQDPERPSRAVEVLGSEDGISWTSLAAGELPASVGAGANFAYLLARLPAPVTATAVKVVVSSGYQDDAWGLGEIEVFGTGAVMETDDDWYGVTADLDGLVPGTTVHYRVVAESDEGRVEGPDATYDVPAIGAPWVVTLDPLRSEGGSVTLQGRLSPLGTSTDYHFEYGPDATYGSATGAAYGGLEITPRTVTDVVTGLDPGSTWHVRLVATNALGTTYGEDVTFVAW